MVNVMVVSVVLFPNQGDTSRFLESRKKWKCHLK